MLVGGSTHTYSPVSEGKPGFLREMLEARGDQGIASKCLFHVCFICN